MSHPQNVKISLQSLSETKIQEIAYDGRETFIQPLSMSESLTDLANRIDFLAEEEAEKDEEDDTVTFQPKQWPWEGIRDHLRRAQIEMNVLTDVLAIAQNKPRLQAKDPQDAPDAGRYLMIDLAPRDPEPSRLGLQLVTKRRCLLAASKILLSGIDRLNKAEKQTSGLTSYHADLLKLRQRWRVRRVGEKIVGDLSFKSAGSDFWHSGVFEVVKKPYEDPESIIDDDEVELKQVYSFADAKVSPIKVNVSSDLRGYAALSVTIRDKSTSVGTVCGQSTVTYHDVKDSQLAGLNEPVWHRKLCNAQNILFCRELFARLSKEAVQNKSKGTASPIVVIGNKLTTRIFPDVELCVELLFSKTLPPPQQTANPGAVFSLKHALMHLLLEYHWKRLNIPPCHPLVSVLGVSARMRMDAVGYRNFDQLKQSAEKNRLSFVDSLVSMAKLYEVRRRLASVIVRVAAQFQDPCLQAHWSLNASPYESSVQVTAANIGFESCHKSAVLYRATPAGIKVLYREGRSSKLSADGTDIYNNLVSVIALHQLVTVQVLARSLSWAVLHFTPYSNLGAGLKIKNRGTLLIASPTGLTNVGIGCNEYAKGRIEYDVHVQYTKAHDKALQGQAEVDGVHSNESSPLKSDKYLPLGGSWNEVDWPALQGRHFVSKMETLLTSLAF